MYEYTITSRLSFHSFDNYQISVIKMSDREGAEHMGIAVNPPVNPLFNEMSKVTGDFDQALAINTTEALLLCEYIDNVLKGLIPRKIKIVTSGPAIRIHIKKYIKKWHGGGGYRGNIAFGKLQILSPFQNITVSSNTLVEFRNSFLSLYDLN